MSHKIEVILAKRYAKGLLIKGSHGVGKSHSLINLTRYLLASGKYWVTIIPDCHRWETSNDFFEFLLQSVGVDPILFALDYDARIDPDFKLLINDIDRVLREKGMQWVFVFDQINALFAHDCFQNAQDVNKLTLPFSMITRVLKPGRIISIISASANNETSHRENHEGFEVFEHPPQFDEDEVACLYTSSRFPEWNSESLEYATGFVPLYLNRMLSDPKNYFGQVRSEIQTSLVKLEEQARMQRWNYIVQSAINCLLYLPLAELPEFLDRKYSLVKIDPMTDKCSIGVLFPLVEEVYRKYFWDDLANYIDAHEARLLNLCVTATQDLRGRLFEQLVTRRLVRSRLPKADVKRLLEDAGMAQEIGSTVKAAQKGQFNVIQVLGCTSYPQLLSGKNRISYIIPLASHFPATDLIIHVGKIVIAFQIHISYDHNEVLTSLSEKVSAAGWNQGQVKKIVLVYLSPMKDTANKLKQRIKGRAPIDWYITLFYSIDDLFSLRDLQWTG